MKRLFCVHRPKHLQRKLGVIRPVYSDAPGGEFGFEHGHTDGTYFTTKNAAKELRDIVNKHYDDGHTLGLGPDHWRYKK